MQVTTTTDREPVKLSSETGNMIILTKAENYADTEILKTFEFIEKDFIESWKATIRYIAGIRVRIVSFRMSLMLIV